MLASGFDRLATLHLFHPLLRRLARPKGLRIPILMYHSISESKGQGVHPYYWIETSPRAFKEQMKFLYQSGYSVISLSEAACYMESKCAPSQNSVVITFDDGYRNFYTQAFPILSRYGFTATVFLPTGYIDDTARQFKGQDCMNWGEIRELHKTGVSFGSHTVNHPQLKLSSQEEMEYEIRRSKEVLEDNLGCLIHSFSYPYAFPEHDQEFKRRLRGILERYGYQNGVSTIIGVAGDSDDRFFMKRLPVSSRDDLCFFRAKLEGGYSWFHAVQYVSKFIRSYAWG